MKKVMFLTDFTATDSAEASAEASVEMAEASGFGRTQFWPVRSFTTNGALNLQKEYN